MKTSILASIALEEESSQDRGFRVLDLIWDRGDLRVGRRLRIAFLILSFQQLMGQYSRVQIRNDDVQLANLAFGRNK